jgi:5-methylcytosine-specific restriction endonuclease McrA
MCIACHESSCHTFELARQAPRNAYVRQPSRDSWANLRTATASQNTANTRCHRDNKAGLKGVVRIGNRFRARVAKWVVGVFDTAEEAHEALSSRSP